ncbi:MAG: mandelate racemase/muconate lactonizing enzyme family protein [Phycisphaerales bacterium]|nr:mandelate racemase/muconate lactonizing enzyme family protein [Phycisphaerae bacterium]NNF43995.1 mandelate racemase/muconate lactonizing enzyme family protein [Phycisphaerales bacterium]NNM27441.1 mandelate racemase/muconate lactonizing enzyme family protein [Phycisphaerales bacterium]
MKIARVDARWLRCPIPEERQHVSDFGRLTAFDATLVEIETDTGLVGYGEAKAAVGSSGGCGQLVACIEQDLRPLLLGEDPRRITRLWETMYSGSRAGYALTRGRPFPRLGRRGLTIAAIGGVDTALWDLTGQSLGTPVVQLLGGAVRDRMPAYASGGWADAAGIGVQLGGYAKAGFDAVKMRVGVMDGTVANSVKRVQAARDALGPDVALMCDAHGTYTPAEAKQFCRGVEGCGLRWFEEPCNADDVAGTAEVRAATSIPIALGESESTRFDIRDAITHRAADVIQPDVAIIGGITETRRIAALCETHQLELAPHLWGSAFSFVAGLSVAFASPAACILEYSLGGNPMLHELVEETICPTDGGFAAPTRPGLGLTPVAAFVEEYTVRPGERSCP